MTSTGATLLASLLANTRPEGDCMIWNGVVRKDGEAQVRTGDWRKDKKVRVPRLVWALAHPRARLQDHHAVVHVHECTSMACINPTHLVRVPTAEAWRYRKNEATP